MSSKLQHPVVVAALSLVISVGLGVSLSWQTLATLVVPRPAAHPVTDVAELKSKGWDFWTIEIENLSNELKEERARAKKQAEALDQRAARLTVEEKEFGKLRADVEGLRKQIGDRLLEIKADEMKNIRTLAVTYSNLTPRAAVAILKEMNDSTAVKILSLMKPDVVAPIFEEMSHTAGDDGSLARRAAMLSEKIRLMKTAKAPTPS